MFPLPHKEIGGYTFGQPTFYGVNHQGTDYKANFDSFYVPFPSMVTQFNDYGGGNWMRFTRANGDVIETAHLSQRLISSGVFSRAGNNAGITGNSGAYTTNPHLHIQVRVKGKLVDPEKYDWTPHATFPIQLTTTILLNKMNWDSTLLTKMAQLQDWFWKSSNGKIQLVINYLAINVGNFETKFYGDTPKVEAITEEWYNKYIVANIPKVDIMILAISKNDWHGQVFNDPNAVEYGYCHSLSYPLKTMVFVDENTPNPFNPTIDAFVDVARHEIVHGLYGLGCLFGKDNTHKYFFAHEFEKVFGEFDYDLLALNTNKIS